MLKSPFETDFCHKQTAPTGLNFTCAYIMLQKETEKPHKLFY